MPISKSKFVSGVQCTKKLFFDYYRKDLKQPVSDAQQAIFDIGHEVGFLAQSVFPGGKDATPDSYSNLSQSIKSTADWIAVGVKTIYEATFSASNAFCMLDILHHQNDECWAIEVKNSTCVKDYHLTDCAFQYWVMEKSNCQPDKFFLMHINNQYVKGGAIEPEKLFHLEDITEQVIALQKMVDEKLPELQKILFQRDKKTGIPVRKEPEKEIGPHCSSPFECDYKAHCWKHVPEKSVFELHRGNGWEWYEKGILKMEDIPDDVQLNTRQQLQVEGVKHSIVHIEPEPIHKLLNSWEYPLYFFDFETINPVLPYLDGTRPYQQIPFQYSLHVIEEPGATDKHYKFLANAEDYKEKSNSDPTLLLLEQMKKDIGPKGSIIAYNMGFEKMILNILKELHPSYSDFIDGLTDRFVDLIIPFRKGWYYHPNMNGSASIKAVLPTLIPELKHSDLDISDGGQASNSFVKLIEGKLPNNDTVRKQLLEYCKLDTWAMVLIWRELLLLDKN